MRFDINIYWVEDTPTWSSSARKLLEAKLKEKGIFVDFVIEKKANNAINLLKNTYYGFKKFDVLFIDFNISSEDYDGSKFIQDVRNKAIDVDVLFYSADKEEYIRTLVGANLSSYEGVYIANRLSFIEKAVGLIEKNTRRQLSLRSIRGMLMDNTSENDFIVKSIVLEKYKDLTSDQKRQLNEEIVKYINQPDYPKKTAIEKFKQQIMTDGIGKIKEFIDSPSYLVPLDLRYLVFEKIIGYLNISKLNTEEYKKIVTKRNILAHKKLEICDEQSHIKYCDTLSQYKARQCSVPCPGCDNNFTISLEEWDSIRRNTIEFSDILDDILKTL